MERLNFSSPSPWEPLRGYSRAVRIGGALYISGTTALSADGSIFGGESAYEQTRYALESIKKVIVKAGFRLEDIVRTRLSVTSLGRWEEYARAHREMFEQIRPASSIIQVARLVDPRLLVEIEADAIQGASKVVFVDL
jgi:enamine deaminase RidA (YjgF/YER057c/UK114 family)